MRGQKRYTTQTFTRRVDHEGGAHATAKKGTAAICSVCGAIYSNDRWMKKRARASRAHFVTGEPLRETVCPSCKQVAERIVGGYLTIDGSFVNEHRNEMHDLIKNEVRRAQEDNPLSKLISRADTNGSIRIETTTEHLAQRLGRALEKAFHGEVTYDFSHENKVARVHWHRDA